MDCSDYIGRQYIKSCKEVGQYARSRQKEPAEVTTRHRIATQIYRDYLDSQKKKMPQPKYHFDLKDKHSWKYLTVILDEGIYIRAVPNPLFKYNQGR